MGMESEARQEREMPVDRFCRDGFRRETDGPETLREIRINYEFHRWPFLMTDYRAAEGWLSEMEAKGLRLVRVDHAGAADSTATFRKAEPREGIHYCIDFFIASESSGDEQESFREYLELCQATGWDYVCNGPSDIMKVFRTDRWEEGVVSLQTDPATERAGLKNGFWNNDGGAAILSILFMGLLVGFCTWIYDRIGGDLNWFAPRVVLLNTMLGCAVLAGGILPAFLLADYHRKIREGYGNLSCSGQEWRKKARKGKGYHALSTLAIWAAVLAAAPAIARDPEILKNNILLLGGIGIGVLAGLEQGVAFRRVLLLASEKKRRRYQRAVKAVVRVICAAILGIVFAGMLIWDRSS